MFNDNLLKANHFSIFIISLQIVTLRLTMSLLVQNKLVSSANIINLKIFDTSTISFIYKIDNLGRNILPCGTPQHIFFGSEFSVLWNTYCYLFFQITVQPCIIAIPLIPYSNFVTSMYDQWYQMFFLIYKHTNCT